MSKLSEFDAQEKSAQYLIGTDEAGRGPAAGDVYAAAVCFVEPPSELLDELNDSKKLTEAKREQLYEIIKANSIWSIEKSDVQQIDTTNILASSLDAMKRACEGVINQLNSKDVEVFVDGNRLIRDFQYRQKFIIKGDAKSASIAAASVLAKVERDRAMKELDKLHPEYAWASNKGYLAKAHIEAIKKHGLTKYHRKLFVRNIIKAQETEQLKLI